MTYFQWASLLAAAFMLALAIWSTLRKDFFMASWNVVGLLAIIVAVAIDHFDWQGGAGLLLALPLAFSVLVVDLVLLWRSSRLSPLLLPVPRDGLYVRSRAFPRPPFVLGEVGLIRQELERRGDLPVRDELQALHLWQGGNLAYAEGAAAVAAEKFRLSAEWVPTAAAYTNLAGALLASQQVKEAAAAAKKAVELAPESFEAWVNHALAVAEAGKKKASLSVLEKAADLGPDRYELFAARGQVQQRFEMWQEAAAAYEEACRLARRTAFLWYRRGLCLSRMGDHLQALRCFRKAARLERRRAETWLQCGNALTQLNRLGEARRCYKRAIRFDPKCAEAHNNHGIACSKLGKSKKAIRSYQQALKIDPNYYEAWLNLALAQDALGMEEDAREAYRRFIELAPPAMKKYLDFARKRLDLQSGDASSDSTQSTRDSDEAEFTDLAELRDRGMIL